MYRSRISIYVNDTSVNRQFSYMKYVELPFVPTEGIALQLKGMDEELNICGSTYREQSKTDPYFDVNLQGFDERGCRNWWNATPEQIAMLKKNGFVLEQEF